MASSLVKKIEKDILSCAICFHQLRDPIGLPCLHGFCFECLDSWHKTQKDKSHLICLACKKSAPVPEGGIRGFPGHFLVNTLRETIDMEKKVENKEVPCKICGKKASVHCLNCNNNLCSKCLDSHNAFEYMKDHKIATVEEMKSGKVTREGRFCKTHREEVRYYCETEQMQVCPDCVSLKTCPMDHERLSLKDAAKKQRLSLTKLTENCKAVNKEIQDAVKSTKKVEQDLTKAGLEAKASLVQVKRDCNDQLEQMFQKHEKKIDQIMKEREHKIQNILQGLDKSSVEIQKGCEEVSQFITTGTEFAITQKYVSMTNTLQELSKSERKAADEAMGYLNFEGSTPVIPSIGKLSQQKEWKLVRTFGTSKVLNHLRSIVINDSTGDVAISSIQGTVKIFSGNVIAKSTLKDFGCMHICATPDSRYLTFDDTNITHYDTNGRQLSTAPHGVDKGFPRASSVDSTGKIVLGWNDNSISIHYAEGSLISQFSTPSEPYRLGITSKGEIVASFVDGSLKLMAYSGGNVRAIQAPPDVNDWDPGNVCCSPHNEIFVINEGRNGYIYRFNTDGKYLGLVTTNVYKAMGVALSKDCEELFVTERYTNLVKVFTRQ